MKKVLALALALVMTLSLASVAFASSTTIKGFVFDSDPDEKSIFADINKGFYLENGELIPVTYGGAREGMTLYIPLKYDGDIFGTNLNGAPMTSAEAKKWKVRGEFEVGGDIVTEITIEYMKFHGDGTAYYTNAGPTSGFNYVLAIKTKPSVTTSMNDLAGTITVYRSSYRSAPENQKVQLAPAGFGLVARPLNGSTVNYTIPTGKNWVISFKDLEDETIYFEGVGELEINVKDQEKMFLRFDLTNNAQITALYPDVKLDYVVFSQNPTFNKWGVMRLFANEDEFIYVVMDGKMEPVNATWDDANDAWRFAAKRLGTFVIASEEIDVEVYNAAQAAAGEEDEGPEDGEEGLAPDDELKPNPDTGR